MSVSQIERVAQVIAAYDGTRLHNSNKSYYFRVAKVAWDAVLDILEEDKDPRYMFWLGAEEPKNEPA